MEYKFQKEFPMPFENAVIDINSRDSKALDWKNYKLHKDFKNAIVDKLNGNGIKFNGKFFIGSDKDAEMTVHSFDDMVFSQRSSSNNCYVFFVAPDMSVHKIMMVRGWGHLTGTGIYALHLDANEAADIQDGFLNWVCERLNEECDTDNVIDYMTCSPDDPVCGFNAQFDEYFERNKVTDNAVEKEEQTCDNIGPDCMFNDSDAGTIPSDAGICWYSSAGSVSAYFDDLPKTSYKNPTPWYVSAINKRHNKKFNKKRK